MTCEKEKETFQAKFVAKVPGTYKIEVKINGQRLVKSPFTIVVKAREFNIVGKLDFQEAVRRAPAGIAVNSKGVIAVADFNGHCILVFDETGKVVRKIGGQGDKDGQFESPTEVAFLNGDEILVADECNHRIQQLNVQTGNFVKSFGKEGSGDGEFEYPTGVCITSDGCFIVVADCGNNRIQVFTMDGEPVFKFGDSGPERLNNPSSCVCYEEKFIVTDLKNNCVKVFDGKGQFLYKFGGKGNGEGQMNIPCCSCVDKYGNLLVCDSRNGRIQQFSLEGNFTGKTSTKVNLTVPWGVTTMPDDRILITEHHGKEVKILK